MLEALFAVDTAILLFINVGLSNPFFDIPLPLVSHLGSIWLWMPLTLAIHYFRKPLGRRLIFGMVSASALTVFLKELILRPRPQDLVQGLNVLDVESLGSFPSGHTTIAFLVAFLLAHAYPKYKWHLYSVAAVVGFTRLYLGVHFPTDVLAGAVLGLAVGYAVVKLLPEKARRAKQ